MPDCTFFGHRDAPITVKTKIEKVLIKLITENNVKSFFVGNHGKFDSMCLAVLKELKKTYKDIEINIVLAYVPVNKTDSDDYSLSIIPDGIEKIPRKFAISYRNEWMIKHCDVAVCYVEHSFGGAARFMFKATRLL